MKNYLILVLSLLGAGSAYSQWTDMSTPAIYHLYAVEAVTDDVIFAGGYGGSLVRTGDGGANWEAISIGSSNWIKEIYFHNETDGWLATTSGSSNPADIYKTTDGGYTWTSVRDSEEYSSMSWPTEQVGYFGTWDGTVVKTTDAGQTWTVLDLPSTENVHVIQFLDAQTGFAMTTDYHLYRTFDGGNSWEKIYHPGASQIYFKDANNGYCVTSSGKIGTTTDGGLSFTYWQTPFLNFKLNDVYFTSPMVGYVVGGLDCTNGSCTTKPAILTTTDGGVTWVNDLSHPFIGMEHGFYEIDCTPNGTPFIAGSDAFVLKSSSLTAGATSLDAEHSLIVSPNPNAGTFSVALPANTETIRVHSGTGRLVFEQMNNQKDIAEIDLGSIEPGIYFLSVELTNGASGVTKVVVD